MSYGDDAGMEVSTSIYNSLIFYALFRCLKLNQARAR